MEEQQTLIDFEHDWDEAILTNITAEFEKFVSEDWVIVGTEGGIMPKSAYLQWVGSGDLVHTRMDSGSFRVKIYGDSAVITSKGTSAGTWQGMPFSFLEWSTNVCRKENGRWVCVLTMLTPAKPD
ncbi:nuclear transport factor 2 family protein [Chitinophaga barathri]|uniref:Nuclear transport factor 2 family protein n=1 Tax=Chitinophaga barathri TaxID=1647451 RepID=A0A3N4MRB1_9BACT|nr:nuclear transport factor 2 family protein [Chitinophaga barathri]RPD42119.1 nuclear transport factor 2 family protein [Chitinophaga barathri]